MRFRGFSNEQAAVLMISLVILQAISLAFILNVPLPARATPATGYSVGQVLGTVQNAPPDNYYFEAVQANDIYQGTPAYRLNAGQNVVLDGKERDANGYSDVSSGSLCTWLNGAFSTTNAPSFNSCNATDCNYTCSLTLSALTPSGYYNVTSDIIDVANADSQLSKTIYVFPFTVTSQAVTGSGGDVILLQRATPTPRPRPTAAPSASPSVSPGASASPKPKEQFGLGIAASEFINKCEVSDVMATVDNLNNERESLVLDFEGKLTQFDLAPGESKSFFFKVKAPQDVNSNEVFPLYATLYKDNAKVAESSKNIRLLWTGIDVCVFQTPSEDFIPFSGKKSVFNVDLQVATSQTGFTMVVEVTKDKKNIFLDLVDGNKGYYSVSFPVFEKGLFDFRVRLMRGFEIADEKLEKVKIG